MLAYLYMHHMSWGWGVLMTLGWIVVLGLVVGVLVAVLRGRPAPAAREVLDRRFAEGEIGIEEYTHARDALMGH